MSLCDVRVNGEPVREGSEDDDNPVETRTLLGPVTAAFTTGGVYETLALTRSHTNVDISIPGEAYSQSTCSWACTSWAQSVVSGVQFRFASSVGDGAMVGLTSRAITESDDG